jgi:hypothetical protein
VVNRKSACCRVLKTLRGFTLAHLQNLNDCVGKVMILRLRCCRLLVPINLGIWLFRAPIINRDPLAVGDNRLGSRSRSSGSTGASMRPTFLEDQPCLVHVSIKVTKSQQADSARCCRFRNSQQKRASDLDPTNRWIPKLDVAGSNPVSRSIFKKSKASRSAPGS